MLAELTRSREQTQTHTNTHTHTHTHRQTHTDTQPWWISSALHAKLPAYLQLIITMGDRSFRVAAARAWNSLPTSVTTATSLASFKRQLKTFCFTKSFP